MWRPIATIAAAARDVELEEPVIKLCWYSIYLTLVLNIFIFLGGGAYLNAFPNACHQWPIINATLGPTTNDRHGKHQVFTSSQPKPQGRCL